MANHYAHELGLTLVECETRCLEAAACKGFDYGHNTAGTMVCDLRTSNGLLKPTSLKDYPTGAHYAKLGIYAERTTQFSLHKHTHTHTHKLHPLYQNENQK